MARMAYLTETEENNSLERDYFTFVRPFFVNLSTKTKEILWKYSNIWNFIGKYIIVMKMLENNTNKWQKKKLI